MVVQAFYFDSSQAGSLGSCSALLVSLSGSLVPDAGVGFTSLHGACRIISFMPLMCIPYSSDLPSYMAQLRRPFGVARSRSDSRDVLAVYCTKWTDLARN